MTKTKFNAWFRVRPALVAVCVAAQAGCSTYQRAEDVNNKTTAKVDAGLAQMSSSVAAPVVRVEQRPYLLGRQIPAAEGQDDLAQEVQFASSQPLSLSEVAMLISQQTGVPVTISPALMGRSGADGSGAAGVAQPLGLTQPFGLAQQLASALPGVSGDGKIRLNYRGSLRGLLDSLAAQTHAYWKYEGKSVRFFLTETRVFAVSALPGKTSMSSTITNAGSSGSSGSGGSGPSQSGNSANTASIDISLDPYKSIEEAIKTVLKQSGASGSSVSSVSVDPTSGHVVVTATPPELDAVQAYINSINAQMAQNVLVEVKVYSVKLANNAETSASFNAAIRGLLGPSTSGALTLGAPLAAGTGNSLSAGIVSGALSGDLLLSALSKVGRTSLVTSGSVIAMNGQPAPLQISNSNGYLASVSTTTITNAGTTTSLAPGSVTSGFSGTFLPLIRGNNILLEYAISLSQNLGFMTASSNNSQIMIPNTALQTTSNRVSLKSGDTIVLAGFEQSNDYAESSNGIASHGRSAQSERSALVITMRVVNMKS